MTESLRDAIAAAMHADSDHGRDGADLLREDEPRGICNCWHKALVAEAAALKWMADTPAAVIAALADALTNIP